MLGGGPQANQWGIKKVYIRSCAMVPWYHSKFEIRNSKKNAVILTFVM
jgi:hypothetical protein